MQRDANKLFYIYTLRPKSFFQLNPNTQNKKSNKHWCHIQSCDSCHHGRCRRSPIRYATSLLSEPVDRYTGHSIWRLGLVCWYNTRRGSYQCQVSLNGFWQETSTRLRRDIKLSFFLSSIKAQALGSSGFCLSYHSLSYVINFRRLKLQMTSAMTQTPLISFIRHICGRSRDSTLCQPMPVFGLIALIGLIPDKVALLIVDA